MKWFNSNYKKFIAGVSGGPDSMALLDYYHKNIAVVCHVNYQKRKTALRDQLIVQEYCKKKQIACEVLSINKTEFEDSNNFQAKARKIRYNFYLKIAKKYNLQKIYIGHNFNDFLETAYMQKKRSNKLLFYGIQPKNYYQNLLIYRPFLFLQRTWIETYCQKRKIKFGIDESNFEDAYERNRVRKIINSWSKDQIYKFKQSIIKHNKKQKRILKNIKKKYLIFKNKNFDLNWYLNQNSLEKYHLIYLFLSDHNFNSSDQKINNIIDFLKSNSKKSYRVQKNIFLKNIDSYLKLVKE